MADAAPHRLTIDHVGHRGDGVAQDGTFVPYTLPGETVEVSDGPTPDRARLQQLVLASAERVAPFCRFFGTCGGCAIQHWRDDAYRAWKRGLVATALAQAGIACKVDDPIDAHGTGRRRLTAHARSGADGILRTGFAAAGSHAIVEIDRCPILVPQLDGAFDAARTIAEALKASGKPLDIQITSTANGLDVDVRGSGPVSTGATAMLSAVARDFRLARLTRHGENIVTTTPPVVAIGKAQVTLPPGSFLQATQMGEDTLGELVVAHAKGRRHIADLFSGIGPFALRLAAAARVDAYDNDAPSITALAKAAAQTPRLKPLRAEVRDLFRRPLVPQELREVDAVVFDPPRQGAQAQAERLAASKVPLVIAVSCSAATFARDAAILIKGGYRLTRVTPVDQFRHSAHVEVVAKFLR